MTKPKPKSVTVRITQAIIDRANRLSATNHNLDRICPCALGLKAALPGRKVAVGFVYVTVGRTTFRLSGKMVKWVQRWTYRKPVKPTSFKITVR